MGRRAVEKSRLPTARPTVERDLWKADVSGQTGREAFSRRPLSGFFGFLLALPLAPLQKRVLGRVDQNFRSLQKWWISEKAVVKVNSRNPSRRLLRLLREKCRSDTPRREPCKGFAVHLRRSFAALHVMWDCVRRTEEDVRTMNESRFSSALRKVRSSVGARQAALGAKPRSWRCWPDFFIPEGHARRSQA